jgi:hypothetical protein
MLAFEIYLNRKRLCVAGIGDEGVLAAIVDWVARKDRPTLSLHVGGLFATGEQHVSWINRKRLRLGDRVEVKVVEAKMVDKPKKRRPTDPALRLRARKRYVREMAKQLGWKIEMRPKPTTND